MAVIKQNGNLVGQIKPSVKLNGRITAGKSLSGRVQMSEVHIIPKLYDELGGKPSINGVELSGNLTFSELGEETITNIEIQHIIDRMYNQVFG